MTTLVQCRHHLHLALAAVVSAGVALAATLYRFPPQSYAFYPQCPFHALTGLLCPGCGATRALAALLHGNFGEAMRLNGLVVVLLPTLAAYGAAGYLRAIAGETSGWRRISDAAAIAGLATTLLFGVGRNVFGTAQLF
jgi:hypothetical protein